jgi:hypothetical protein
MRRDFEIKDGIYLSQPPHELDLHNNFDFCGLHYSIEDRTLSLHWRRSKGDWVATGTPASVSVGGQSIHARPHPEARPALVHGHPFHVWCDYRSSGFLGSCTNHGLTMRIAE